MVCVTLRHSPDLSGVESPYPIGGESLPDGWDQGQSTLERSRLENKNAHQTHTKV